VSAWLGAITLAAAGLAWLESRRPNRAHLASRIIAVLVAIAAIILLLNSRPGSSRLTLLTPGAPLASHSREAVSLEQVQSLATLAGEPSVLRLAGWGLLPHEWPDPTPDIAGFESAALPHGITQLDAPTETGVGERLIVRGAVTLADADTGWVILEDPAGARDSTRVSRTVAGFALSDRPRAPGAVLYRLRVRSPGMAEVPETLGVAVREVQLPSVLILDGSPSFETGYLKRWLGERGARVTVRTTISRGKYRTERLNDPGGNAGLLTAGFLARYQAVLADGSSLGSLSTAERAALERQVRERGLGLLVTADAPALIARGTCGLLNGFVLSPIAAGVTPAAGDKGDRRVARPVLRDAPRQSRTGIEAEATSLRPAGVEPLVQDEVGRMVAGWRKAGSGRVALTLLRTPSRWILEGEPDLFAAYWYAMLRAVARDTTTRAFIGAEGPIRADHPVFLTVETSELGQPTRNAERSAPVTAVISPSGALDTVPLAQDPFDPSRWTGRYWPRTAGWHRLQFARGRSIPFRVSNPMEWIGVEASARLAATAPRVAGALGADARGELAHAWLGPLAFAALVLALSWLWVEGRLQQ
jgi:hypothetical protein